MIPSQSDIEIPLLEALVEVGGEAKPKDLYPFVANKFSQLTPDDLEIRQGRSGPVARYFMKP